MTVCVWERGERRQGTFHLLPQALGVCDTTDNESQVPGTVCIQLVLSSTSSSRCPLLLEAAPELLMLHPFSGLESHVQGEGISWGCLQICHRLTHSRR